MPSKTLIAATAFPLLATLSLALPPPEKPLPPREAAAAMTVPDGFKVTLFAGEPDVSQPIAMCFDDRGRLWVAECHSYPNWIKPAKDAPPGELLKGDDRILIFEDSDNDGVFDKKTVFMDKLANLTSIEFGFGGIYALTAPYLIHIPMDAKTDRPTGAAKILLDGWNLDIRHNIVNGLKWGPDGWLYGCHGILNTSYAGKPGTPKADRPPINCGVWRFHPVSHKYEVVAHGGTNPWGIDWDEQGELYFTNCVIDHAFHVIPGGHYQRMYGSDFNPHLYKLMGSCCDHLHWGGGAWTTSRGGEGKHSEAGGGHAHSGCMIYLGDNFPKEYRNNLFTGNIHGNRLNRDRIDYTAKGPILRHEKDFLKANDPWFRPLAMDYGPDGGVYVIDWTDTGECHNYEVAHKTSGRIYKVRFGDQAALFGDLSAASFNELLRCFRQSNGWNWRHATRILQERRSVGKMNDATLLTAIDGLEKFGLPPHDELRTWRAIAAASSDCIPMRILTKELIANSEPLRLFGINSAMERYDPKNESLTTTLEELAKTGERSVRSALASGMQRLQPEDRWSLAGELVQRFEDADDSTNGLLLWYAVESLPALNFQKSVALVQKSRIPLIREFLSQRIASLPDAKLSEEGTDALLVAAVSSKDSEIERSILRGLDKALNGRRSALQPKTWEAAYPYFQKSLLAEVRDRSTALAVIFGDERALKQLRSLVKDAKAELPRRQDALKSLVFKQPDGLRALLGDLLDDPALRSPAIRALAAFKDDQIPPRLIALYPKLNEAERADAIATLISRPTFALALLDAVADKTIERKDLGPFNVRQMLQLNDGKVAARVVEVWGTLRPTARDKVPLMAKFKASLTPDALKTADHALGKTLYTKHCASCHKLFGEGAAIGPDLTGSQRDNLDYILENVLDPSAIVPREYQVTNFQTASGRTVSGIVKEETARAVFVQTPTEIVVLPKDEIESRVTSKQSMMPDGVFEQLSPSEARALVAYLGRATPLEKK